MGTATPADTGPLQVLDAAALTRWATVGRDALQAAREEIDGLNVYPVPDGDTGTNLHLTVAAAVRALTDEPVDPAPGTPGQVLATLARGALLGARGSSGVILSQLLRGFADAVASGPVRVGGRLVARALDSGSAAAYAAVDDPVEGTMLTVARAAAEAAAGPLGNGRGTRPGQGDGGDVDPDDDVTLLARVVTAAALGARAALARSPDELAVLGRAGVVDAGGRGVCVLVDALASVVTGVAPQPTEVRVPARGATMSTTSADTSTPVRPGHGEAGGPAYEVMFLLDAPAAAVPPLRAALGLLGDALVVVGGEPTWNVHVHVDDVGAAVEAGVEAGRPHRIRVTDLRDQAGWSAASRLPARLLPADSRGVVGVVAGDGLAQLFESVGATVVSGGAGRRATTQEVLAGLRRAGARDLIVLPNDGPSLAAAQAAAAAARDEGLRVAVVPTKATVAAIAALAIHDPTRRFEDDVIAMSAAAGHCRHGGVTVATREAVTMAGVCRPGDALGVIDGDFALIGSDLGEVAIAVAERMLGSGGELVTLVTGAGADPGLAVAVVDRLRRTRPDVDTVVHDGGQPGYPLLIGVE